MEATAKRIHEPKSRLEIQSFDQMELTAIQANIRRYGWQSLAVRLMAITLASFFILCGGYLGWQVFPTSFRIWPVVVLFLLWMLDGHFKFMQQQYVEMYPKAVDGAFTDLAVKVDDKYNVASLWRPLTMVTYVALIGLIALANLGF
ncbi:MAG: hypothetical protein WC657_02215 [Candidatus Paceibacterota bacterium]